MIKIYSLTKKFGHNSTAVNSVSLSVSPGEIVGLLGENGAGKTTLLRMLATMLKPTSGTATINTFDINTHPVRVRTRIGIVFGSEVGLYDRLTARENIQYFAELNNIPTSSIEEKITELSELFKMREYLDRRVGTFSKGMKQKTALARSIIHNPPVMLLDEPTSSLDVSSSKIVRQFIRRCKQEKRAILLSSHNLDELKKLCDRVIIIHQGNLLDECVLDPQSPDRFHQMEHKFLKLIEKND
jgi:sodium transport system ATP-binding protein